MDLEVEIWKAIDGFGGLYSVSNFGRVRRNQIPVIRLSRFGNPYECTFKETFIRYTINKDGYYYVGLCINGKPKQYKVHRLVAEAFIDKVEGKNHIDHIDCNKLNNSPSNLRWCTHAENIQFAWQNGVYDNIGSKHGMSKLTEGAVVEIKKAIANGGKNYIIAKDFNVSQQTICDIRKGRLWNHV